MPHEQLPRSPESGQVKANGFDSQGMSSRMPPAMQLVASSDAPAQFQARSVQHFGVQQTVAAESEVEGTTEYAALLAPGGPFQEQLGLTAAEARLTCLLMIEAVQAGQDVDLARDGMGYAQQARERLTPAAGKGVVRRLGTEINEVTEERAQELMDEMAGLTFFNEHGQEMPVPYHYPPDGCYARAHLMAERLTAMGYASEKQFVVSRDQDNRGKLRVDTDFAKDSIQGSNPHVLWNYHVAPVINVRDQAGNLEPRILDPSMTNAPIPVSSWVSMMSGEKFNNISITELKQMLDADGHGFAKGKNLTYASDRAMMFPHGVDSNMTDEASHRRMNAMRRRMSGFSKKEEAHKLAHDLRSFLKSGNPPVTEIIRNAEKTGISGKAFFRKGFPQLLSEIRSVISPSDYDSLINAIQ